MKLKLLIWILAFFAVISALFAVADLDVSGTWIGKAVVPDGTEDELTVILNKANGNYTGTVVDAMGLIVLGTEFKDITFVQNELKANFPLANGTLISFRLKFEGDKMSGEWMDPQGTTGTLEFVKKK